MKSFEEMYNDIPIGRNKAITKEALMKKWGAKNERSVRLIISELRNMDNGDNYIIVSFSGGKGYYRTDDYREIEKYKTETINRARHTFTPLRKINRVLAPYETAGQLELIETNNLKAARIAAGLQAKDVVKEINRYDPDFNKTTMSLIENGKCLPTKLQLSIMTNLYGCGSSDLIGAEIIPISL